MMKKNTFKIPVLLFLICIGFSIKVMVAQADEEAKKAQHLKELEALKIKRDSTLAILSSMNLTELVNHMNKDSQTREHFNSPAYREIIHKRRSQGQALFDIIGKNGGVTYIPLMALMKINKEVYEQTDPQLRLAALEEAFKQTKMYNRWGIPHLYWQAPAKAMIGLGKMSEATLKTFLTDKTPADIFGYEEELELEIYKYRRCDYALAMLMAIRNQNVKEISKDPTQRDDIIKGILME